MIKPVRSPGASGDAGKAHASEACFLDASCPARAATIINGLRSGKRYLFTGDLTWAIEGFEIPAERPWLTRKLADYDEAEVRHSIVKVHQLMQKYPDLIVVPAHDRRVHDRISSLPNFEN
jgi:hypothetical protein